MRRLRSNPIRQVVAAVLALGLSICCCQVHFLIDACAAAETGPGDAVATCCTGCQDEAPSEPGDDRGEPLDDGCQSCCIKGTGLKDLDVTTATISPVAFPAVAAATVALLPSVRPRPQPVPARVHLEAPTLLRLRCALLI